MSNLAVVREGAAAATPVVAPVAVADVLLEAAVQASADLVWIEPVRGAAVRYLVSLEREGRVLATATLDAGLGAALIARLAFIAHVDLTSPRVATGAARVRSRAGEREVVFTLRPGAALRAEVLVLPRGGAARAAPCSDDELAAGTLVDHYCVLSQIGSGGMGAVYHVEHAALGRQYALKVLHARVLEREPAAIDRFLREARAASRIRHPNIVDVFDFGYLPDGRPYFVMELLEGVGLSHVIDRGALPVHLAIAIAHQIGEALAAAHAAGVIHADVSAPNVIAEQRGDAVVAKLVDFGLAELRGPAFAEAAPSEVFFGTPCYIAPELVRGQPADERSDQYSFGVLLYEMLAGRPPFVERDARELCLRHLRDPAPPLTSPHGPLPPEVVRIVERALAKSPAERFPSMRVIVGELGEAARLASRRGWQRWLSP